MKTLESHGNWSCCVNNNNSIYSQQRLLSDITRRSAPAEDSSKRVWVSRIIIIYANSVSKQTLIWITIFVFIINVSVVLRELIPSYLKRQYRVLIKASSYELAEQKGPCQKDTKSCIEKRRNNERTFCNLSFPASYDKLCLQ